MQQASTQSALIKRKTSAIYRVLGDRIFLAVVLLLALSLIALTLGLGYFLYLGGSQTINKEGFFGFLTGTTWDPALRLEFGIWPYVVGTLITSLAALVLSVPVALAAAIFTAEYAPRWLAGIINYLVDLMAAVPSVVYGIWGIFVLAPFLREAFYLPVFLWASENAPWLVRYLGNPAGYGLFTGIVVLSSMIIPFTAALSRDAISLVPVAQREGAYALGATRWEVMQMVILPYARGGIFAGAMLALGRALGETMAIAMVIGNGNILPYTLFGPASTMPAVIALELKEAVEDLHYSAIIGVGFFLFLIAFIVNATASYLLNKLKVSEQRF
ncbi:MAG: phosphate ABC transporter permease subunit PstC [Meiothermus sp.]|uniref:phosphate ABC transporter permease subunit PstC n=1 Tax=Meiothermus sp. TaxID=1955249 RepID=UPI0025D5102E|nr:phosphate ABC transporter permease subunit PstC [Meiothermus sp.]MCS7057894.1 phosphate ABC transporter permease subunit PstC [Meiothermus sp.]MCS7194230.1 phosphate ABC transporter permease subunit PstC [Meiothermus sp.]MCX7740480.1 phosphate ABC transporter permease subunit PstC [Meiothermus sp.]MDW8090091.1 phosphate ABC transporter permease subunit PstC [Meiothermus sp.]MDW8480741.1 phosphate ABC transporter permease subunit PstC [Meiothermus sp.]